jgi:Flp pilus assembly protein TadG
MISFALNSYRRRLRKQRGATQVEFALTIFVVIIVALWMIEMIGFIYSYSVMADAAKEGVRYAVVRGCGTDSATCSGVCAAPNACTDSTGANVRARVLNYAGLTFHDVSNLDNTNVLVTYPDGPATSPNRVRVVVQYPFIPWFGRLGLRPTVRAAAEGRIVN